MKVITSLLALVFFASVMPVDANPRNRNNQKAAEAKKKKEKEERERKAKINQEIEDFIAERDKNNDRSLTLEEYTSGESNAEAATSKFKEFNKNNDRYLTKYEVKELMGLK